MPINAPGILYRTQVRHHTQLLSGEAFIVSKEYVGELFTKMKEKGRPIFSPHVYIHPIVERFLIIYIQYLIVKMIYYILFILVSCSALMVAGTDNSCDASPGTETLCNLQLYSRCRDASLWMEKPQWQSCSRNQVFWNYPKDNLTVTFIRPPVPVETTTRSTALRAGSSRTTTRKTTRKRTTRATYKTTTGTNTVPQFCLSKDAASCTEVYRITSNGEHTKVIWTDASSVCFRNPVGVNCFKFRFEAKTSLRCFGVFIKYWFK